MFKGRIKTLDLDNDANSILMESNPIVETFSHCPDDDEPAPILI